MARYCTDVQRIVNALVVRARLRQCCKGFVTAATVTHVQLVVWPRPHLFNTRNPRITARHAQICHEVCHIHIQLLRIWIQRPRTSVHTSSRPKVMAEDGRCYIAEALARAHGRGRRNDEEESEHETAPERVCAVATIKEFLEMSTALAP